MQKKCASEEEIMNKKKLLTGLMAMTLGAASLTACGEKETAETTASQIEETTVEETTVEETEETTVEDDVATSSEAPVEEIEQEVTDPFSMYDYSAYKTGEQLENGNIVLLGEVVDSDMFSDETSITIVCQSGPVVIHDIENASEFVAGDFVKAEVSSAMAMSYPGQVTGINVEKAEEADVKYPASMFEEIAAVLPEADNDEDGVKLVAYIRNNNNGECLIVTNSGEKVADIGTAYMPKALVEITYSGAETRSLPPIMMDITNIAEIDETTASEYLAKINEIIDAYDNGKVADETVEETAVESETTVEAETSSEYTLDVMPTEEDVANAVEDAAESVNELADTVETVVETTKSAE